MTPIANGTATAVRSAIPSDATRAPAPPQTPLERLLATPGPLDRFGAADAPLRHADADHGAAPLR